MTSTLFRLFIIGICSHFFVTSGVAAEGTQRLRRPEQLTDYDLRVLENGRVEGPRRVFGTLLAVVPGFGVGHAVQGRYLMKGAIFTFAEAGSLAIASGGGEEFSLTIGILGFIGLKIWEFVDSLAGPARDNRRYELLKAEIAAPEPSLVRLVPVPLIKHNDSGSRSTHLGLALTWDIP